MKKIIEQILKESFSKRADAFMEAYANIRDLKKALDVQSKSIRERFMKVKAVLDEYSIDIVASEFIQTGDFFEPMLRLSLTIENYKTLSKKNPEEAKKLFKELAGIIGRDNVFLNSVYIDP